MDEISHIDIKRILNGVDDIKKLHADLHKSISHIENAVEEMKNKIQQLESKIEHTPPTRHV